MLLGGIPPNILDTLEGPLLLVLAVADVAPQPPILGGQLVDQKVHVAILGKLIGALAAEIGQLAFPLAQGLVEGNVLLFEISISSLIV